MKVFYCLLLGQAVSLLGTSLTNFGLSVWVYEDAGSVMDFTWVAIASTLPTLIFSPIAGALIDRWPRKLVLVVGQLGSVLCTLTVAALYWSGGLAVWHIIPLVAFSAIFATFLRPGFTATIVLLVDSKDLGRANGAVALAFGIIQLISPALAGALILSVGLEWVFVIDLATFTVGIGTVLLVTIPVVRAASSASTSSIKREIQDAWHYLKAKKALVYLLCLTAVINFNLAAIQVLVIPVVLGFADKAQLGMVMSIGGAGMIVGGILMMTWGGPDRKILGFLSAGVLIALLIMVFTIVPSIYLFSAGAFLAMAAFTVVTACAQSIWQRKVDVDMQGRLFSFRSMALGVAAPLAYLSSGYLADRIFEPLFASADALQAFASGYFLWLGDLYGYGAGRGVAVMISLYGVLCLGCLVIGCMNQHIRNIDLILPDCEPVPDPSDVSPVG